MIRPISLFVVIMLAAAAGGCASMPESQGVAQSAASPAADLDSLAYGKAAIRSAVAARAQAAMPVGEPDPPYTLDTGDRLRVVVFGQDGLSNSYVVDAGGAITMPLIKSVAARGRTTEALARSVAEQLRSGYVREPHVAIEVEAYRPFFILGEVSTPGQYAFVPRMTVEAAVAVAGGFTPRASRHEIRIDRPHAGGTASMVVSPHARIRPGDTVVIAERWF